MSELIVDFITSLDGYASGDGWPGYWGLEGPEYLAWLGEQPEATILMGAKTYRVTGPWKSPKVEVAGREQSRARDDDARTDSAGAP